MIFISLPYPCNIIASSTDSLDSFKISSNTITEFLNITNSNDNSSQNIPNNNFIPPINPHVTFRNHPHSQPNSVNHNLISRINNLELNISNLYKEYKQDKEHLKLILAKHDKTSFIWNHWDIHLLPNSIQPYSNLPNFNHLFQIYLI